MVKGRRVLVTGASGFIGSHVVRQLLVDGADVWAMSSSVSSVLPQRLADVVDDIHIVEASVADRSSMDHVAATAKPEIILHLAAFTHVGKSFYRVDENVQVNIQGTVNLLEALKGNFERFVYTGSSEIYGDVDVPFREDGAVNPVSPYSVSKYAGERYCRMFHQAYDWPITCLRPFNAYGPWQTPDRIVPELILKALRKEGFDMTDGRQTREFNYVEDLARAFVMAADAPDIDGEVINVGCGEEISIRDVVLKVLDLMGNPVEPRIGALEHRPTEIWRMYCDNTKAQKVLGWSPNYSLEQGLQATIEWFTNAFRSGSPFLAGSHQGG